MLLNTRAGADTCGDGDLPYGNSDGNGTGYGFDNGGGGNGGGGLHQVMGTPVAFGGNGCGWGYKCGRGMGDVFHTTCIVNVSGEGPLVWVLIKSY